MEILKITVFCLLAAIGYAAGSWGPPASSRLTAIADTAWHEELNI